MYQWGHVGAGGTAPVIPGKTAVQWEKRWDGIGEWIKGPDGQAYFYIPTPFASAGSRERLRQWMAAHSIEQPPSLPPNQGGPPPMGGSDPVAPGQPSKLRKAAPWVFALGLLSKLAGLW